SRIADDPAEHVARRDELRFAVLAGDRRAPVGQGDRRALDPIADGSRVDRLARTRLERRADRRFEIDLLAPGLRDRLERQRLQQRGSGRRRIERDLQRSGPRANADRAHFDAVQFDRAPAPSKVPEIALSFTLPEKVPFIPARRKLSWSPFSFTSSSATSLPSRRAEPVTRVTCCLRSSRTGPLLTLAGTFALHPPATFAGTR